MTGIRSASVRQQRVRDREAVGSGRIRKAASGLPVSTIARLKETWKIYSTGAQCGAGPSVGRDCSRSLPASLGRVRSQDA